VDVQLHRRTEPSMVCSLSCRIMARRPVHHPHIPLMQVNIFIQPFDFSLMNSFLKRTIDMDLKVTTFPDPIPIFPDQYPCYFGQIPCSYFYVDTPTMLLLLWSFFQAFWVFIMFCVQTAYILTGVTTNESMNHWRYEYMQKGTFSK
jgi:hypothetical protein